MSLKGPAEAECDNCSRVIEYVVTYGARYEANALIQMRVHDVNVLTDLDAVNPTTSGPQPYDDYVPREDNHDDRPGDATGDS